MGIIRSRATIEQQSSNEVEQPLLKKWCPFVDTPVGEEESESDSGGEEHEDNEESESDSGKEEDGSSTVNQECLNNNHKEGMVVSEEEESDSSESESVGDSEGSNSPKALHLLEGGGKVVQSISTTEKNGEFKSQELCPEVDHPLVKSIIAPEGVEPESDSAEEEENSFSGDANNNYKQTKVVNDEEDESSSSESEGDTEASDEQDGLDLGEKLRDDNHKQFTVVSEKEEDGSSGSESDGDTEASTGQEGMDLGEKLTNNSHKQSRMVNEEDEDDLSGSESEGNSEASHDHEDLDLGGEEELNKTGGTQFRATTEKHQDSKSPESCSKIGSPQVKKLSLSSVASHDRDKENGRGEEKSESDPEEEEKSSSSGDTDNDDSKPMWVNKEYSNDNHKKTVVTIVGNEEEGDESESEGDNETSCEQEDLHLFGKKERSNVTQPEPNVGKYVKKAPEGEKNQYCKWSDDDVITLLEGLVKVMDGADKGKSYVLTLRDLIGNSIHFKPSIQQIREKIRRLRIKYVKYMSIAGKSHANLSPHEARVVELCKMVWDNELKTKNVEESHCQGKNVKRSQYHRSGGSFRVDYCSQATEILKEGFDFITGSKNQSVFEEDWVKLQLQEIQLYQEKLDMMKKHLDQVTDELQASLRSCKKADQTSP